MADIVKYQDRDGAEITLTPQDVVSYCYSGNAALTDRDVVNFMATCQALGANPFLKDVYLVKYGSAEDAQIMAGKNYYTRVAAAIDTYDGMTAGIICAAPDGTVTYRNGSFAMPGETCVGGWAEVHDKRWSVPVRAEVAMGEYNSGRSLWKSKPMTMIRKVALVQALREAYPDRFAGTYDAAEMPAHKEPAQPSDDDRAWIVEASKRAEAAGYDRAQTEAWLASIAAQSGIEGARAQLDALLATPTAAAETATDAEAVEPDAIEGGEF